jgi:hypothetical protein
MTNFTADGTSKRRPGGIPTEPSSTPEDTIKAVLDWVGDDFNRAQEAYADEFERDEPRKGVYEKLEKNFPLGTVEQVLEWVGDDEDRAAQALEYENSSDSPRVSLVEKLERKAPEDDEDAAAKA